MGRFCSGCGATIADAPQGTLMHFAIGQQQPAIIIGQQQPAIIVGQQPPQQLQGGQIQGQVALFGQQPPQQQAAFHAGDVGFHGEGVHDDVPASHPTTATLHLAAADTTPAPPENTICFGTIKMPPEGRCFGQFKVDGDNITTCGVTILHEKVSGRARIRIRNHEWAAEEVFQQVGFWQAVTSFFVFVASIIVLASKSGGATSSGLLIMSIFNGILAFVALHGIKRRISSSTRILLARHAPVTVTWR